MAEHIPDQHGFWRDTWRELRRRPKFLVAAALIVFIVVVAVFPEWFTGIDPTYGDPSQSLLPPSAAHWFGTDLQGHDIYARTIYGARASVMVGLGATLLVFIVGGALGALAGFYGGWIDAVVSRITDVFFGLPLLLAAIVLTGVLHHRRVWTVIVILAVFGWPQIARIARGAVLEARASDYVLAAKALGLRTSRSWFATRCPTLWALSSRWPPSPSAYSLSPRPRCHTSASGCQPRWCPGVATSTWRRAGCGRAHPYCSIRRARWR